MSDDMRQAKREDSSLRAAGFTRDRSPPDRSVGIPPGAGFTWDDVVTSESASSPLNNTPFVVHAITGEILLTLSQAISTKVRVLLKNDVRKVWWTLIGNLQVGNFFTSSPGFINVNVYNAGNGLVFGPQDLEFSYSCRQSGRYILQSMLPLDVYDTIEAIDYDWGREPIWTPC